MKQSSFFLGPPEVLTQDQLDALSRLKAGAQLSQACCQKLEMVDLAEKGLKGWMLTQAGEYRLAAGR